MNFITEPWPWYVSGPLIGLFVPLLLIIGNKQLGISSSLKHICAACLPVQKIPFFNYDWKKNTWNLFLVFGITLGAFITNYIVDLNYEILISDATKADLSEMGITNFIGFIPAEIYSWNTTLPNLILMVLGGFLIGFGTRYANGCTSGHAIMGLSLLNLGSLIAVIGFFIGGLVMTHLLFPLIF
ncbi:MAG: YeeE/YedE thiosulfate transporter family protein [Vicingaceae bacterium]|nr:YeeE/YedE thiosulfate transporter family protein [Vicingaceae bacterium]